MSEHETAPSTVKSFKFSREKDEYGNHQLLIQQPDGSYEKYQNQPKPTDAQILQKIVAKENQQK